MPDNTSYLMPNQGHQQGAPVTHVPDGQATVTLGNLLDVLVPSPTDGQTLTFVASAGKWEAVTPAGGVATPLTLTGTDPNTIPLKVVGANGQVYPVFEATTGVAGQAIALGADGTVECSQFLVVSGGVGGVGINSTGAGDPATDRLTVQGSAGQTAHDILVTNNSAVQLFGVAPGGDVQCGMPDGSAGGVVIYDSAGVAWRLVVAPTTGALTTTLA